MKKILLITSQFPYGTGEQFLETEIIYLSEYFKHITIVPMNCQGMIRSLPDNVDVDTNYYKLKTIRQNNKLKNYFSKLLRILFYKEVYHEFCFNINKMYNIFNIKKLISELSEAKILSDYLKKYNNGIDIFYSYWNGSTALSLILLKDKYQHIKIITRVHGGDLYEELHHGKYLPFRKLIYHKIDQTHSISEDGINYIKKKYFSKNSTSVTYLSRLGVKKREFCTLYSKEALVLVSCSNFVEEKRFDLLIDIIHKLAKQTNKKIVWFHIGSGQKFDLYREKAFNHRYANLKIFFQGYMHNNDIFDFYKNNNIDLFINVSSSEGIPVSIMEVYSCSIPAIATNVGGTAELVNIENGFLIEKDFKVEDVITILMSIIKNKKILIDKKYKAYKQWENKYNAKKNYADFIKRLLK